MKLNPKSHGAHYGLGLALLALDPDNRPEAKKEFQIPFQIEPRNADALFQLGTMATKEGQVEEAVTYLQKAVHLQPELAEAHSELGKVYQQQNRYDAAEKAFQTAIRYDPQLAQAFFD